MKWGGRLSKGNNMALPVRNDSWPKSAFNKLGSEVGQLVSTNLMDIEQETANLRSCRLNSAKVAKIVGGKRSYQPITHHILYMDCF